MIAASPLFHMSSLASDDLLLLFLSTHHLTVLKRMHHLVIRCRGTYSPTEHDFVLPTMNTMRGLPAASPSPSYTADPRTHVSSSHRVGDGFLAVVSFRPENPSAPRESLHCHWPSPSLLTSSKISSTLVSFSMRRYTFVGRHFYPGKAQEHNFQPHTAKSKAERAE